MSEAFNVAEIFGENVFDDAVMQRASAQEASTRS